MKILELEWRNIFSYGNNIEHISFDDNGKLWQLSGISGAGKSSFLIIPKLLFYGKHEGQDGKNLKVNDIANWVNKNGWIKGLVKKGNNIYTIIRTFAPSGLELYKNNVPIDKAGLKNIQEIIENEILDDLPYNIFSNVLILSLNNFKSFLSMSPADKRTVIDKIFSLEIINKVHELIKSDIKSIGNAINLSNSQIYSLEQTIKTSTTELKKLSESEQNNIDQTLILLQDKMQKVLDLYNKQYQLYQEYSIAAQDIQKTENTLSQEYNRIQLEIQNIKQKLILFNESKCPTCGTPFTGDLFDNVRTELQQKLDEQNNISVKYSEQITVIKTNKNSINESLSQLNINIQKILSKKSEIQAELTAIQNNSLYNNQLQSIQNIINETNLTKQKLEDTVIEHNKKMSLLNIMETLYSADGIKQQLMSNYIPILNDEIKNTLSILGFPYTLEFDLAFNPNLKYLGREISPANISTGEHKKLDLTVICAIIRMLKQKYPQINIMCLDETVSSLDYESSTEVIKYLKTLANNMGLNLFIVSHTQLDENLFDEHLYIEKNNGFTTIKRI